MEIEVTLLLRLLLELFKGCALRNFFFFFESPTGFEPVAFQKASSAV